MLRYTLLFALFLGSFLSVSADTAPISPTQMEVTSTALGRKSPTFHQHWKQLLSPNKILRGITPQIAPDKIKKRAILSFAIGVGSVFSVLLALISPYFLILFIAASLAGFIISLSTLRSTKDKPEYHKQHNLALAGLIGSLAIWACFLLVFSFYIALNAVAPD